MILCIIRNKTGITTIAKLKLTPQLLEDIIARIPEGYIRYTTLNKKVKLANKGSFDQQLQNSLIARTNELYYDSTRVSREDVRTMDKWCRPALPHIHDDGHLPEATILERIEMRAHYLEHAGEPAATLIVQRLTETTPGYAPVEDLAHTPEETEALDNLVNKAVLKQMGIYVYDPLRLSQTSMQEISRRSNLLPYYDALLTLVSGKPGNVITRTEALELMPESILKEVISLGGFSEFRIPMKVAPYESFWIRMKGADMNAARAIAEEAVKIKDEDWEDVLLLAGDVVRDGAEEGSTRRAQVFARSYTVNRAAKELNVHQNALELAISENLVMSFLDPEEKERIPAYEIASILDDIERLEQITAFETVRARDVALVTGLSSSTVRRRLARAGTNRNHPDWGDVRGKWGLPTTFHEYKTIVRAKIAEWRAQRAEERAEQRRAMEEQREREHQEREELRAKLVAAFPAWQHEGRNEQRIWLHVGPPNSGKTHDSLNRLVEAGSGWYLAPLRLLAFEIFDRLNQRGVPCNLLTGEEYIPVPGATITAATIEMFNPAESGECVVIDEAQLLADADRGWAWTRAMMQARAPEMHMIGPMTARDLIEQMARAAAIPIEVVEHQRLAPIQVAEQAWTLDKLPPHTILVAFSRRLVLQLKTELEMRQKRSISVIYGSLPPEVRRKQADRFANGETEICIATDAVGMGLNLPADYVCFYELEKFDGKEVRTLTPSEVQQIGGRAGRYGIRQSGEVGAINKRDLRLLQQLFYAPPEPLTHARVAPTVEDLELIPGSLYERLLQWAALESIPESLRNVVKVADLAPRIELAKMLTDEQVAQLGFADAVQLINAPTRQGSQGYWLECAFNILAHQPLPLPPAAPSSISNSLDLEQMENCIACADVYLWLARRKEFGRFALDTERVHDERREWSMAIDRALVEKIDTKRQCPNCGRPLPISHQYRLCDNCFYETRFERHRNYSR
ncbi:MAG: hypothetical protein OHK0046_27330 [Anaerolineae bacterium]